MQYRALAIVLLLAACGDDGGQNQPDAMETPDAAPDAPVAVACTKTLEASAITGGSYDPRFTIPGFSGFDGRAPTVYDFATDVDGSVVATGEFQYLGGQRVKPLLRFKDGVWAEARTTWELEPPGAGFSAVAIDGTGVLALATNDDFGERDGEIWIDAGAGLVSVGTFVGLVRELFWYEGELWVAGAMEIADGDGTIANLAVWTGEAWAVPPGGVANGPVYEVIADGEGLLVGGAFTSVGGIAAASVAAYSGTAWTAANLPDTAVYALGFDAEGALYAAGTFGQAFGDAAGGLVRFVGPGWELVDGGLGNGFIVGVGADLALHDDSLYVAGCFSTVGGGQDEPGAVEAYGVARYDGGWHSLDNGTRGALAPWFEPRSCGDEGPLSIWDSSKQRLFSTGDDLYLGGSFPGVAGVLSQSIVALNGNTWAPQGPGGLGIGGSIDRIATSGDCDTWALGTLTHAGGVEVDAHLLHFTGTAWEPITDTLASDAFCNGLAVAPGGEVTISCIEFAGKSSVSRLYRPVGTTLQQVGEDQPLIQSLAYDPSGQLWIAGGGGTGFVARLDGTSVVVVEDGFDGPVMLIDPMSAGDLLVAGSFTTIDGAARSRIARWDGAAWQALGTGLPATATALARSGARVYASTYDEGNGQLLLGVYDGTTWTELATPASGLTASPDFNLNAIRVVGAGVVVGGSAILDDGSARGALVFDGARFSGLGGGGVRGISISDLAVTSDAIWVAGPLAEAGPADALVSTIGVARYVIPPVSDE